MDDKADTAGSSFIYTNWRGKSFIIDEKSAKEFRDSLIADGERPEDVAYLTPDRIMEDLAVMEKWERHFQLEEMWEKPEAKTDR